MMFKSVNVTCLMFFKKNKLKQFEIFKMSHTVELDDFNDLVECEATTENQT